MQLNQSDIEAALREMGLAAGDIVLLHSSLSSLGRVDGGAQTVVDAFLSVLGADGTLIVPTFGNLGVIPDVVKADPRAVSSHHPMAGVAAIGKDAEAICREHWTADIAHTENTPYYRIAEMGGYVCMLGADQDRNTTLHACEEKHRLAYMQPTPEKTFETPAGQVTRSWLYFPGPHRVLIAIDPLLRRSGKMHMGLIGNSVARLIKSRDLLDIGDEFIANNPTGFLCDNPNCADCVEQRAALLRDRFSREAFTLAAAASLAGRYVPEIIDNAKAVGVDDIELDAVRGTPVCMMSPEELSAVIDELRAAGLKVSALRGHGLNDANTALIDSAAGNKVPRVVLPLSADAAKPAAAAKDKGVSVSFCNVSCGATVASSILLQMREAGVEAGFTFNGVNFVRGGEKPFLFCYKQKLRRFVDQFDLCDATFDSRPEALARGNAEVQEMISILRCSSFPGRLVLAAENRQVGSLADAMSRLVILLDTM